MSAATPLVCPPQQPVRPEQAAPSKGDLMQEHLLWLRHCARAQQNVSASVAQMAARIEALEADVLRLRAQAVRSRSAALWGLGGLVGHLATVHYAQAPRPSQPGRRAASAATANSAAQLEAQPAAQRAVAAQWPQAEELLCQTGCASHAHHWLQDDGQCQRKGGECERVPAEGQAYVSGA